MINVFISYSHNDVDMCRKLRKFLVDLSRDKVINHWYDGYILGGGKLNREIRTKLNTSDVIILLISQDYLSSEACKYEMDFALKKSDVITAIPIILKPCTKMAKDNCG